MAKQKHVEMIIDYVVNGDDFQYSDNHGMLIRCKDCEYSNSSMATDSHGLLCGAKRVAENHYCGYARRREE